ncbi:MAG TPA: hypothetical protein VK809_04820 [Bacteroidia bacterium]|jgi:hypothetical protein|nr:hypothetical protein [Bacteroidia bacterium]
MKNPWLAFVLNLLLFGGGYIYNGKRKMLGFALVIAWVLIRYGEIKIFLTNLVFNDWLFLFIGLVVLMFSLAADAYSEAKRINAEKK